MSAEGNLRKSKRQPVPNPIYSQGINELKKVMRGSFRSPTSDIRKRPKMLMMIFPAILKKKTNTMTMEFPYLLFKARNPFYLVLCPEAISSMFSSSSSQNQRKKIGRKKSKLFNIFLQNLKNRQQTY